MSDNLNAEQRVARQEVMDVLQKNSHLLGPYLDDVRLDVDGDDPPSGQWLLGGWVLSMNWSSVEDGSTWSVIITAPQMSRAEQIGLACLAEDSVR